MDFRFGWGGTLKFWFWILRPTYVPSDMVNTVFIITLWLQKLTLVETQCGAEETEWYPNWLAKNMQSNGWPFKSWVFCWVHWVLNSGARGLTVIGRTFYSPVNVLTTKCMYATDLNFHRMSHSSVTWHASVYPSFTTPLIIHAFMSWVEQAYIRFAQSSEVYRYF